MSNAVYRQCILRKSAPSSYFVDVAWIPERFAVKGKVLKVQQADGLWDDGWRVWDVLGTKTAGAVRDGEQDRRRFAQVLAGG